MKKHSRLPLNCSFATILFLTSGLLTGCSPLISIRQFGDRPSAAQTSEQSSNQETDRGASSLRPKRPGEILKPNSPFYQVVEEIISDFNRNDFAAIDAKANKARKNKERLVGCYWKIKAIYEGLVNIYSQESVTDVVWQNRINKLLEWKQQFPQSITARVALGQAYISYAWFTRGTGFSNTVSKDAGDLLDQRLERAENEFREVYRFTDKCPQFYESMLFLATARSWNEVDFDQLFDEAVNFEPDYYYFYYRKAENLSPRWGGKLGDWEKFAETIARDQRTDEADLVYFLVVSDRIENVFKEWTDRERISWPRMKKGFADLERKYGADNQRLNQFALNASVQEDMPTAYAAFKRIGDNWNDEVWASKKRFDEVKGWAIARYEAENPAK
jgi:hypothetical protein